MMPLRAILMSFEDVLEGLTVLGQDLVARGFVDETDQKQVASCLGNAKRYTQTFIRTSLFLQQRGDNTATLIADTLAFRNQGVAQEQNGSMLILTKSAVFITVITLIYLPWTLVTVCSFRKYIQVEADDLLQGIFGMEFFEMNQSTRRLITSPQIWIYFATAAGATIVTVILYWALAGFPRLGKKSGDSLVVAEDNHVPQSLQRGYTDIEKSLKSIDG